MHDTIKKLQIDRYKLINSRKQVSKEKPADNQCINDH